MKNADQRIVSTTHHKATRLMGSALLMIAALLGVWSALGNQPGMFQCGEDGTCEEMANSKWGSMFGLVPLAWCGAAVYVTLAACAAIPRPSGKSEAAIKPLAAVIMVAAAWFTTVQLSVFGKLCPICSVMHGLAVVGSLIILRGNSQRESAKVSTWKAVWPWAALLAVLVMIIGSPLSGISKNDPAFVQSEGNGASLVAIHPRTNGSELTLLGKYNINSRDLPRFGSGDAKQAMVLVTNFACPHCLRMMKHLHEVAGEIPSGEVAIHLLPVALDEKSADALSLLLAVWRANPAAFDEIVMGVVEKRIAWNAQSLQHEARARFSSAVADQWLSHEAQISSRGQVIQFGEIVKYAAKTRGLKGFPQIWIKDGAVQGAAEDTGYYYGLLASHLNVHRQSEPLLSIEGSTFAYGKTPMGGILKQTIKLSNTGAGILSVSSLQLPERWKSDTKFPLEVAASMSAEISVDVISPREIGPWKSELKVRSNSSKPATPVQFSGEAVRVWDNPGQRIELPTISVGSVLADQKFDFSPQEGITVEDLRFNLEGFQAAWASEAKNSIAIRQTKPLPIGGYIDNLVVSLRWTGSPVTWSIPTEIIPVAAHVKSSLIVTPMRVVLPPMQLVNPLDYVISVRTRDASSKISPTVQLPKTLAAAGVTATLGHDDQRQAMEITLHFPAAFDPTPHLGEIVTLQSGTTENSTISLPVESSRKSVPGTFSHNQRSAKDSLSVLPR